MIIRIETKFAETTVTFQPNHPTVPIDKSEVSPAVASGIITQIKLLNIKANTIKCLSSKKFLEDCKTSSNPYGVGNAGIKIAKVLKKVELNEKLLVKKLTL